MRTRAFGACLLCATAVASVLAPVAALAQSPAETPAASAGEGDDANQITVTARKRDETLKDVPVAVSVYSAANLEKLGAKSIEGTLGVTPGLYVGGNFLSPSRDYRQLVIRGVGANSPLEPSVATFVDGVYSPALDFDNEFLDIDHVEVLRGPQGALFGRNTEGGAVNVVTRKPSLTETHGEARASYGSFNTAQASASISTPLVGDVLAGSLSVQARQGDNFYKQTGTANIPENPYFPGRDFVDEFLGGKQFKTGDGERQVSARGKLRYAPDATFEAVLAANFSRWVGQDQAPGPLSSCHCYTIDSDQAFESESKNGGVSLTLTKKLPTFDVNFIVGYSEASSDSTYDHDGTSYRTGNWTRYYRKQTSASAELRLSSNGGGRFNWLGGIYAYKATSYTDRWLNDNQMDGTDTAASYYDGLWNQQLTNIHSKGLAGFGQLTYNIVPDLELAVGGRYSYEQSTVTALERFEFPANDVHAYLSSLDYGWSDFVTPVSRSGDWSNFSPQASLRYRITPEMSAYVTVSKGFKAGSFQTAPVRPTDVTPINPEKTTNYEIGLKGSAFDRLLQFDADLYYVKIKDQQLSAVVYLNGSAFPSTTINNVSSSHAKGFELTASLHPTSRFTLGGNVALVDSEFDNYHVLSGGAVIDRSGQAFPSTPKWTWNVDASYTLPLPDASRLVFTGNYRKVSSTYVGSNSSTVDPIITVPAWDRIDAAVAWEKRAWTVRFAVQNLADKFIVLSRFNSFNVLPLGSFVHDRVAPPRNFTGSIAYKF